MTTRQVMSLPEPEHVFHLLPRTECACVCIKKGARGEKKQCALITQCSAVHYSNTHVCQIKFDLSHAPNTTGVDFTVKLRV